jgi:hypothetical protein
MHRGETDIIERVPVQPVQAIFKRLFAPAPLDRAMPFADSQPDSLRQAQMSGRSQDRAIGMGIKSNRHERVLLHCRHSCLSLFVKILPGPCGAS